MPQHAAEPIVAAACIVMCLQTIVSRKVDALQAAVVTLGLQHAGQANNVIPASVVVVNRPAQTAFAHEVTIEVVGAEQVTLQGRRWPPAKALALCWNMSPAATCSSAMAWQADGR